MPQYHFGIQTDRQFVDEQGVDLADHAAARAMAIQTCGELMRDGGATFWGTRPWKVTVSDEVGLMLFTIEVVGHGPTPTNWRSPTIRR